MGKLDSLEGLFKSAPREYFMELPPTDIRAFLVRAAARRGFVGSQEYVETLYDMWREGLIEVEGDHVIPNLEAMRTGRTEMNDRIPPTSEERRAGIEALHDMRMEGLIGEDEMSREVRRLRAPGD